MATGFVHPSRLQAVIQAEGRSRRDGSDGRNGGLRQARLQDDDDRQGQNGGRSPDRRAPRHRERSRSRDASPGRTRDRSRDRRSRSRDRGWLEDRHGDAAAYNNDGPRRGGSPDVGFGGAGGRRDRAEPPGPPGETYLESRRRRREASNVNIWPPSPLRRDDSPEPVNAKRRAAASDLEEDDDEDSERSDSSELDRKRKKSKSSSKKHQKKERKKQKKSKKKKSRKAKDASDTEQSDAVSEEKSRANSITPSENASVRPAVEPTGAGRGGDAEIEDYWQERPVTVADDAPIGPVPYVEAEKKLDERAYGGALLAGEGSAMAAYIQSGKRIPRRGEIGLTSNEIESYEKVGYVMSGSRHRRMNAVRIRKENQVISAEEKNALLLFNQQEKIRKENETIALLKEIVEGIVGSDDKGSGLSYISLVAGLLNLVLALAVGALNDRVASRGFRRRGWMVAGAAGMCISLPLIGTAAAARSLVGYAAAYLAATATAVFASVPFNGLLADVTNQDQRATVSAVMGALNLGGYLGAAVFGALVATDGVSGVGIIFTVMSAVVLTTVAVTVWSTGEPSTMHLSKLPPLDWRRFALDSIRPLWANADFRLVFLSRFLFQLGIATVQQFLQYWISDCVDTDMPSTQAVSFALLPLLVLSPIGAMCVPRTHRKNIIYVATVLMIAACILLQNVSSFGMALLVSGLFGIGYGPFVSTEFAMLMDVLPSATEAAKDIALWHSALVLPQIVATP
ncbi:hypothetical protein HK405_000319, partial [Cladochytrium tenue]